MEPTTAESDTGSAQLIRSVDAAIQSADLTVERCREILGEAATHMEAEFRAGGDVPELVRLRATVVDRLLIGLWTASGLAENAGLALVAVGGYGRGELHPCSDVDLMVLADAELPAKVAATVSTFLTGLWDTGLDIGHSVRTIDECVRQATADIAVATSLMEARRLAGPEHLLDALEKAISADRIWPSDRFFEAKRDEQQARHHRYDDTAYKLEPNVKGSPGGLRDIQMVGWVAMRHFGGKTLDELVSHRFLSAGQLSKLEDGRAFLWRIPFRPPLTDRQARGSAAFRPPGQPRDLARLRRRVLHARRGTDDAALLQDGNGAQPA